MEPDRVRCGICGEVLEVKGFTLEPLFCGCDNYTVVDSQMDDIQYGGVDLTRVEVWDKVNERWEPLEWEN
jgi:hypothetical protein